MSIIQSPSMFESKIQKSQIQFDFFSFNGFLLFFSGEYLKKLFIASAAQSVEWPANIHHIQWIFRNRPSLPSSHNRRAKWIGRRNDIVAHSIVRLDRRWIRLVWAFRAQWVVHQIFADVFRHRRISFSLGHEVLSMPHRYAARIAIRHWQLDVFVVAACRDGGATLTFDSTVWSSQWNHLAHNLEHRSVSTSGNPSTAKRNRCADEWTCGHELWRQANIRTTCTTKCQKWNVRINLWVVNKQRCQLKRMRYENTADNEFEANESDQMPMNSLKVSCNEWIIKDFFIIFDFTVVGERDCDGECANCDQYMGFYVGHN